MTTEDDKVPTPPLFRMNEPFENMNGTRILVSHARGKSIGSIVCYHRPGDGQFGIRIDVIRPPVMDPVRQPAKPGDWQTIGTITEDCLFLTQATISKIKRADSPEYSFELSI